ncbi:thiol reductant ABC exporter subunit CydD [Marinomonas ostreistagni]|uniref:thiol reductant ABC exporter subunit CydD n=1 Tax=Marinomonas ostreistagni TaxID=359209 RepID=UPI001950D1F3|nr:thiol reductant ABC exporter subunit CydD [Marinomonas ostreistagni]MBM6551758.1 thiol reductant ABC exporter subunit CydD [Marinomonas ostreistagni]
MKTRETSPEQQFLKRLEHSEKRRYRLVKGLGIVTALAIVAQALGLAQLCAQLVLEGRLPLDAALLAGGAFILKALAQALREQLTAHASRNIRFALRQQLVELLATLGPNRLRIDQDAGLSTRVYEQVDALDDYFSRYLPQVFLVSLIPLTILLAVAPVSWVAFAIFMLTAPLVILFMILVGHKAAQANRKQFAVLSLLSNQFLDLNQGLAELKRLGQTGAARERLAMTAQDYQKTTMSVLRLAFLSTATLELFASVAIAMVALYLGLGLLEQLPWQVGVAPVSLFAAFFLLLLAPEFYLPLRQLGNDYHAKQKAEAAATDLLEILATQSSASMPKSADSNCDSTEAGLIDFRGVAWQQQGRQRIASFHASLAKGDRVWLRGTSGVGKSSLMTILLGFEADYSGSVLIEGLGLESLNLTTWRRRLAWLPQTPEWVSGTIRQNLELGIGARSDDELRQVLIRAHCWDVVGSLKMGWDTPLSEAGTGLSGGQMQRLSIARALLSEADIWLLDEPCSGLDEETADQVLNTLDDVSYGKTVLIISHDSHPVVWANKHWLMSEDGVHVKAQTPVSYV